MKDASTRGVVTGRLTSEFSELTTTCSIDLRRNQRLETTVQNEKEHFVVYASLPTKGKGSPANIIRSAILSVLDVLDLPITQRRPNSIMTLQNKSQIRKVLVVIPSDREIDLIWLLGSLLRLAYGQKQGWYPQDRWSTTYLKTCHFLFLRLHRRHEEPPLFTALAELCKQLKIGETVEVDDFFKRTVHAAAELQKVTADNAHKITAYDLRRTIEDCLYPSGVSEILEVLCRCKGRTLHAYDNPFHIAIDYLMEYYPNLTNDMKAEVQSATRLLLGAMISEDITIDELIGSIPSSKRSKRNNILRKKLESIRAQTAKNCTSELDVLARAKLTDYISGRKVLVIEDLRQIWEPIFECFLRGSMITWEKNAATVVEKIDKKDLDLTDFDLILLDLYSSKQTRLAHHEFINITTVEPYIGEFLRKVDALYQEETATPEPLPQIVVFSRDTRGTCVRTMVRDWGCYDFFFKITKDDPHKDQYYSALRNCLVGALEKTAARVAGLSGDKEGCRRFHDWISQFTPAHRPHILRLMKHFRYFPAMAIVRVLGDYCNKNFIVESTEGEQFVSVMGSQNVPPSRLWFTYLGRPNKSGPATLSLFSKSKWFHASDDSRRFPKEQPQFVSYDDLPHRITSYRALDDPGRRICVVFLDDMVLSGGQVTSYLWKFLNRDLREAFTMGLSESTKKQLWDLFVERMKRGTAGIDLHVISAIHIKNNALDRVLRSQKSSHPTIPLRICRFPEQHEEPESDDSDKRCNCPDIMHVSIGFAAETTNLRQAYTSQDEAQNMENILSRYIQITHRRENEFYCQFEPWGWKECKGLVATYANAPGNTLPVIWGKNKSWNPLHIRYYNPGIPGSPKGGMKCLFCDSNCVLGTGQKCGNVKEVWKSMTTKQKWNHFYDLTQSSGILFSDKVVVAIEEESLEPEPSALVQFLWQRGEALQRLHFKNGSVTIPDVKTFEGQFDDTIELANTESEGIVTNALFTLSYRLLKHTECIEIQDLKLADHSKTS
jgi:hypothetical protein